MPYLLAYTAAGLQVQFHIVMPNQVRHRGEGEKGERQGLHQ